LSSLLWIIFLCSLTRTKDRRERWPFAFIGIFRIQWSVRVRGRVRGSKIGGEKGKGRNEEGKGRGREGGEEGEREEEDENRQRQ
jgi:hypothetical protein